MDMEAQITSKLIAIDTETTGFRYYDGQYPFLLTAWDGKKGYAFKNIEEARYFLEDETITKIGHNLKFDLKMLKSIGIEVKGQCYDTMVMAHLFNENLASKSLAYLSTTFLDDEKTADTVTAWRKANKYTDKRMKEEDRSFYELVPDEIMIPYGIKDTELTYKLFFFFKERIEDMDLWPLFMNECALMQVLTEVEYRGVEVDIEYLEQFKKELEPDLEEAAQKVFEMVQEEFDIASNKQLGEILKRKLGIQLTLTAKGNPNAAKDALQKLGHPIAQLILNYRHLYKIYKTYVVGLLEAQKDGVVHCDLHQIGARTGRFSSFSPNLQNIPKKDPRIRRSFLSREGYTTYYIDYKQMEYRMFAEYAQDEWLINEIKNGADFHDVVAQQLNLNRVQAKNLNFGLIYGMGVPTLMEKLELVVTPEELKNPLLLEEAQGYYNWYMKRFKREPFANTPEVFIKYGKAKKIKDAYFSRFKTVDPFIRNIKKTVQERGFIFNKFKRRRRLEKDKAYKAVNALCQGCCADVVKHSMVSIGKDLEGTQSNLILMIHDEVWVEIRDGEEYLLEKVVHHLTNWGHMFDVPLEVDIEYSNTHWGDKKLQEATSA